jgi:hypothetical protein
MKVCCDFWSIYLTLLFVAFVELLGLVDALFCCLRIFLIVWALLLRYWSIVDMSGYFGPGPLWTWVKNDDWFDPSSIGTLTHVKMIETCVESAFATVCVQSAIVGCFLLFWWGQLGWVGLHQVTWSKKLNNKLKVIISLLSETKSESFTLLFYGNPLNSARGFIQMAVTATVVTKNVDMSRR